MSVIPSLGRLRQEDCGKFQARLGYRVKRQKEKLKKKKNQRGGAAGEWAELTRQHSMSSGFHPSTQKPDGVTKLIQHLGGGDRSSSRSSLSIYPVGGQPGLHETLSKKSVNNICDSHPVPPSCSLQRPLSPHCGRRVNCTVRTSGTSKAEVSSVRLCLPRPPAIPASPLSSPTATSVQYALPVGSLATVLSPQSFRPPPLPPLSGG